MVLYKSIIIIIVIIIIIERLYCHQNLVIINCSTKYHQKSNNPDYSWTNQCTTSHNFFILDLTEMSTLQ